MDKKIEDNKPKNMGNEVKTPLSAMMEISKSEIGNFAMNLMETNHIPPFLMCYIMKSVLCDIYQITLENLSDSFAGFRAAVKENKTDGN